MKEGRNKMKVKLVIVCLVTVVMLAMLPSISAVDYQSVKIVHKKTLLQKIISSLFKDLRGGKIGLIHCKKMFSCCKGLCPLIMVLMTLLIAFIVYKNVSATPSP